MFTGLVQALGTVKSVGSIAAGVRLTVDRRGWAYRPKHGDSIAVNGCCLTHAPEEGATSQFLAFDVVHQTLARTTLGGLRPGDAVNLESCLTPTSPIGGHFVQGHIDGVATIEDVAADEGRRVTIGADLALMRYIVPTGSVAVDGVSLTVAAVDLGAGSFTVALIPTTLRLTTLGQRKRGDRVNIEVDVLVKAAMHYMEHFAASGPTS